MNDKNHRKKMVAPIIITVFFLIYLAVYLYLIFVYASAGFNPLFLLISIPLLMLGVGLIIVLVKRIKEIRSGEEDDLSNY